MNRDCVTLSFALSFALSREGYQSSSRIVTVRLRPMKFITASMRHSQRHSSIADSIGPIVGTGAVNRDSLSHQENSESMDFFSFI